MPLFRLIRWPNLLIVAITQLLIYFKVLQPIFQSYQIESHLDLGELIALIIVTLIITACGYIINDILDQEIDPYNKPNRLLIGPVITEQIAIWTYNTLGFIGFIISIYLGFSTNNVEWIFLYPTSFVFLYWYSYYLKKRPLIGNLIVALFCAGVSGIIWLAEWPTFSLLGEMNPLAQYRLATIISWYMVYALLSTLFREIVKDMEDMDGDRQEGCYTVPIAWGITVAKGIAIGIAILLGALLLSQIFLYAKIFHRGAMLFSMIAITAPLIFACYKLIFANTKAQFRFISHLAKLIMLNGLLLLLFVGL